MFEGNRLRRIQRLVGGSVVSLSYRGESPEGWVAEISGFERPDADERVQVSTRIKGASPKYVLRHLRHNVERIAEMRRWLKRGYEELEAQVERRLDGRLPATAGESGWTYDPKALREHVEGIDDGVANLVNLDQWDAHFSETYVARLLDLWIPVDDSV